MTHDVVITGIGLVSSLGVGVDANWAALTADAAVVTDAERLAPYTIHPAPEIDWSEQIAKRGDQRQMETWQRLGTYAAGLALDDSAIKGNEALTGTMDLVVGAGGGERDVEVDTVILSEAASGRTDTDLLINEKLTTDLRPTLFLAQLSNLLAGNISIVHKVIGSSRTFMGEEGAGMSAIRTAAARIAAGQSTHALVGGAHNGQHPDQLLSFEIGQVLHQGPWAPIHARANGGGIITGSGAAFLVLESGEHARRRGVAVHARLGAIAADSGTSDDADVRVRLSRLAEETGFDRADLVISAASGASGRLAQEQAFLDAASPGTPRRFTASRTGHLREAQMPFALALAALSIRDGTTIAQADATHEAALDAPPQTAAVLAMGHQEAEAIAMVHTARGD